jgi:RNA-directed DNA polymerase
MKESHVEGVAIHDDPESCIDIREGGDEALTGARAGRVLSREMYLRDADAVMLGGRQHRSRRDRETWSGPARSETPCTYGTSLCENREICEPLGAFSLRAASGRP